MQYVILIAVLGIGALLLLKKPGPVSTINIPGIGDTGEAGSTGGDQQSGNSEDEIRIEYQTATQTLRSTLVDIRDHYGILVSEDARTCGAHAHNRGYPQLVDRINCYLNHYNNRRWLAAKDIGVIRETWEVIRNGAWIPHLRDLRSHGRDCDQVVQAHIDYIDTQFRRLIGVDDILNSFYSRYKEVHPESVFDKGPDGTYICGEPTMSF